MHGIRQPDVPTGKNLRQTAPGLYVDEAGAQYFYLTGMYSVIAQCIGRNPLLYTPAFMVNVLGDLRIELRDMYRIELLD
jgi:hypothetical protein